MSCSTPSGAFVYNPSSILGSGGEGTVFRGNAVVNDAPVAIKVVPRGSERESEILNVVGNHPNIIGPVLGVERSEKQLFLVLPLYPNGDVHAAVDRAFESRNGIGLKERQARRIFLSMLRAVAFLHSQGYCHLDLKLENWLLSMDGNEAVLADFGFSAPISEPVRRVMRGPFTAPEARPTGPRRPWDGERADVWSLGVCLAAMVSGFVAEVDKNGFVRFGPNISRIPRGAHLLMRRILQVKPDRRPTLSSILRDRWLGLSGDEISEILSGGVEKSAEEVSESVELFSGGGGGGDAAGAAAEEGLEKEEEEEDDDDVEMRRPFDDVRQQQLTAASMAVALSSDSVVKWLRHHPPRHHSDVSTAVEDTNPLKNNHHFANISIPRSARDSSWPPSNNEWLSHATKAAAAVAASVVANAETGTISPKPTAAIPAPQTPTSLRASSSTSTASSSPWLSERPKAVSHRPRSTSRGRA